MKRVLLIIIFFSSYFCNAQNYQCLQSGVKHYFTNGNGYLRGIRIDSARTIGSDIIYYPFHTLRGNYYPMIARTVVLDSNGGSWLGKRVLQEINGTFLFDNIWHDTIVIKTQAQVGDSWTFYNDTTKRYYLANLIAADTLTISGILDSVKKINITAYDDTGYVPADPVNNFQIILSKNNGFVQAIDLYTFPYHAPDTVYGQGFDFYLDQLLPSTLVFPYIPLQVNSVFSFVEFIDPAMTQLYEWNTGDVFENSVCNISISGTCMYPYQYYFDSITNKTILPNGVRYDFSGWIATQHLPRPPYFRPDIAYSYDTQSISYFLAYDNKLLIDTVLMPEQYRQPLLQYYFPNDSSYCLHSCLYKFSPNNMVDSAWEDVNFESSGPLKTYKTGLGLLSYYLYTIGNPDEEVGDTTLRYYMKAGVQCGSYVIPTPSFIQNIQFAQNGYSIYPNPAYSELTITSTTLITQITITNLLGQTLYTNNYNTEKVQIDVAALPTGVYFIKVNGTEVRKFLKQ